jgi:hypothetical protein
MTKKGGSKRYERSKRYYEAHRNEILEKKREYHKEHQEEHKNKSKSYYAAHRDKMIEDANKYSKKWYAANRDKKRLSVYGLSVDKYNLIYEAQDGRCAICHVHQYELNKPLYVDHNHDTGEVRGLLCHHCNIILGHAGDNIGVLLDAVAYLRRTP